MSESKSFSEEDRAPSILATFVSDPTFLSTCAIKRTLGRHLKTVRRAKKVPIAELARRLNVDVGEIFRAESADPLILIDFQVRALLLLGEEIHTLAALFQTPGTEE